MYYFLWGSWIVKIVNCTINLSQLRTIYCAPTQTIVLLENKSNHYHSIFKFNTVVPNLYSHNTAFNPQTLNLWQPYRKFQVCLIDLSEPAISILYGLQIDNGIRQCVNSNWIGIFSNKLVVHVQYIRFAKSLLISIYQKW